MKSRSINSHSALKLERSYNLKNVFLVSSWLDFHFEHQNYLELKLQPEARQTQTNEQMDGQTNGGTDWKSKCS